MSSSLILAIDQGTSNTKAIVVNVEGQILARATAPMAIGFPRPAWVEQDPIAIWQAVRNVIDECVSQISPDKLAAIGISNQRETILAWDRGNGQPLGPAIVWQCRRTADFCQQLRDRGLESFLRERTGLTVDPLFSGSKGRWPEPLRAELYQGWQTAVARARYRATDCTD
jgi:glycerol kinase